MVGKPWKVNPHTNEGEEEDSQRLTSVARELVPFAEL